MMKESGHRILLIEPPFYRLFKNTYSLCRYPLSLGYLAGTIRKETDWDVMVYNADFFYPPETIKVSYLASAGFDNYLNNLKDLSKKIWQEVKSTILEYKPTVVGITAKSQNFASCCLVAKFTKEVDEQIMVVVGGPHPSMVGPDVLNCANIDVAVKGEGENTIVELLNAIESRLMFDGIKGICYRENGQIVENPPRELIKDLDSLCFPHQSAPEVLKDYNQYPLRAFSCIFAIRGCPFNCFFCGSRKVWTRKVRFRSVENVIKEIKSLQKMGLKAVHFDDDTFGVSKKYITDLCNAIITHCPGLKWSCEIHVKLVSEQIISLMKTAGCHTVQVGVESGNNEILKAMRKNITIEEALSACEIIEKHGIMLEVFFIVGFPQETEETLNDTVKAIRKSKRGGIAYSIFTPYPGTESFEFCKENGLIDDNYDVSLYNHQSPRNCFCLNISPERFRTLASKLEKMVDRRNWLNRIKRIFSLETFRKIQDIGIRKSLLKGVKVLISK